MRCLETLECSERKLHCSPASDNVELSHFPSFFSVCTQKSTNSIQRLAMLEAAADPPAVGAADIVAPIAGLKEPDAPAVLYVGQIMILEDVQFASD